MPVDTSIYGAFSQPAKSTADYNAQYDAQDARRMALQTNALALQSGRQKLDEYQRGVNEQGVLRNALMGLGAGATDEQRIQTMRGTGLPGGYSQADALQKTLIERDKGQAESRAKQAEVLGKVLSAQGEFATQVIANPTRESAMAAVAKMRAITQALGVPLDLSQDEQQIAQMTDPAQITRWAQGHSLKATDFLAKLQQVNNGKTTSFVDTNSVSNPGGPAPIAMTTTPGEDSTAATARAGQAVTMRGQNMTAGTAAAQLRQSQAHFDVQQSAPTWDATNQVFVDRKAQTVKPGTLPDGQPMPGKTLNDSQAKSYLFGSRMQDADKIIADMAEKGVLRPSNMNAIAGATPLVGGIGDSATNWMNSGEQSQVKQAKLNFMTAALRRESGASIATSEFETFDRTYFPQIGDKPDQIKNKAALRQRAIEGVLVEVPTDKRPKVEQGKPKASVSNW